MNAIDEKWEGDQVDAFNEWMLTANPRINQFSALAGWMACARATVKERRPRYANVSCSNCGREFGPGDHGFSHCENHANMKAKGW